MYPLYSFQILHKCARCSLRQRNSPPHAPDPEDKEIAPGLKQLSTGVASLQVWRTEMTLRKELNGSQNQGENVKT